MEAEPHPNIPNLAFPFPSHRVTRATRLSWGNIPTERGRSSSHKVHGQNGRALRSPSYKTSILKFSFPLKLTPRGQG